MSVIEGSGRAAEVSSAKRALLEKRLRGGFASAAERQAIPRRPGDGPAPLSFAQRRLWFLEQMEPGTPLHNLPGAFRLRAPLDPAALRRAATGVVRRHDALRAVFTAEGGEPVQSTAPARAVPLPVADLSRLDPAAREAEARRRIAAEAALPFDLASGLLARVSLLRLGADEHVLLVTHHHIASDGWSMSLFIGELLEAYRALAAGAPVVLRDLPLRFADFAAWQRDALGGDPSAGDLAWWRGHLAGAPGLLELPTDRPRPPVQGTRGAIHVFELPAALLEATHALARAEGATPYMVLLAAFYVLLSRWSGQEDVVVGSPVAGRTRSETERLVGFFANTLPLRTDLSGDPTFRALLGRVRETTLGAYARQDVPFERMVEALRVERSLAHAPVFQVMFTLQNNPGIVEVAGFRLEPQDAESGTAKFDLTLGLEERDGRLEGLVEYATALFDADTAGRLVEQYRTLLEGIVAAPSTPVSRLPLLSAGERARLLAAWSGTAPDRAADVCLHELFEARARRTPDAVALVAGDERIAYAELRARAERLGEALRARGVGPEVRVGVCTGRGAGMVVAVLGILRAGGAYVPLDPKYPRERLALVLEDAAVSVLVAEERVLGALPEFGGEVVLLDGRDPAPSSSPGEPGGGAAPENLAYLIYTSGSTGRPKGVQVEHRSAFALLHWAAEVFPDDLLQGVLASTSLSFDLSVFELFLPLSRGGTVVLAEDALALASLPARGAVTLLNTVPSAAAALVRAGAVPPSVRVVCLAGEALKRSLADDLYALPHVEAVYNLYGPSEDTTYSTWSLVPRREERAPAIGRAVTGTRALVLDGEMEPAPVGVPGELYLGGAGLARGYLGRPEATAERFVPDAFGGGAGGRLYRTGDRVRWLASGELEFLGRLDQQVKLRGFRIEPGEVEAALAGAPGVRDAVVVLREDVPGGPGLAGYLVPCRPGSLSVAEVRRFLRERLPEPMVPTAWSVLEALPLTPNGKTDRAALPAPEGPRPSAEHVAPRTRTEETLAGIWAEVLGVGPVGAEDDFLELGGHSLLAMRVVARIQDTLGTELPLGAVLEARTLAALAARVEAPRASPDRPLPPLRRYPELEAAPLSSAQQRLWLLDRLDPGCPVYNVPAVVGLSGALDRAALERALAEIVRRHDALRTTLRTRGGEPVQTVAAAGPVPLPVDDLSGASECERAARLDRIEREEARRPFDLVRGPLFRARLVRFAEAEHELLLTMHHVVADGWSLEVLFRELGSLYGAFAAGRASALPEPPVRYGDFSFWQRQHVTGQALASPLEFWVSRLRGAPLLDLPADRPRPARRSLRGGVHRFTIPAGTAARLGALGRAEGATPFMALLAAFKLFLARHAGEWDVVVGSPIAGRAHRETEGVVGFFANTLALRTDLSGDPSFREALRRVRETTLGAYAHQDVPFERLVEALGVERDASRNPVFQVMFALRERLPELEAAGVRMTMREGETGTAKFDLFLELTEGPDGTGAALEYASDLFDRETVERMAGRFLVLLDGIASEPDRPASALPLLPAGERRLVAGEWNGTDAPWPREARLHDLFSAQAARSPGAVALVHGGRSVTYAELDAASARVAGGLRACGIGPESRVGICLERTPELVVTLLGVLRAGAAYVPLDPAYPRERIAFILRDAAVPVVLTQRSLAHDLPAEGSELLLVGELSAGTPGGAPDGGATAQNAAYLIYTSGSTGTPKGVVVEHRSAVAFLEWARGEFAPEELSGVLASTSVCFDLSVFEVFLPLAVGGSVVLAENALELPRIPDRERVTLVNTVPSAAAELARAGGIPASVRSVNLAGEPLKGALVEALYAAGVGLVRNLYGPSEDTTYSTWTRVPRDASGEPTIGRPVANTRAYVLDRRMEPAPVGVPGELYLAGAGVARGYLGRPELTAERFVPDAFAGDGGRLYRTGDRARWSSAGELEFLGRLDQQVKLRGFRIEPGEIEAVLLRHPSVREAVVVVRGDAPEEPRLVAYVVTGAPAEVLRAYLAGLLPAFMVPAGFVLLAELPKTPNGKTDRAALPAPGAAPPAEWIAPRTETETELARIWAEALGRARIGAGDHFFRLGGHSLLATRVIAAVWESFGVELPLHRVFEAPTLAGMAEAIDGEREAALARMLAELDEISDEEVRVLLAAEGDVE